jgi:hypothetical protein
MNEILSWFFNRILTWNEHYAGSGVEGHHSVTEWRWWMVVLLECPNFSLESFEDMGTETVKVLQSFPQNLSRWLTSGLYSEVDLVLWRVRNCIATELNRRTFPTSSLWMGQKQS